jgi:hypothetical protein
MAIDLPDARIDPYRDRADERRLTVVRAETGPEVVVLVRPSVDDPRMRREPMSRRIEGGDQQCDAHDDDHGHGRKHDLARRTPFLFDVCVTIRPT